MKYNIQINQLALSETDLDVLDCAILDYLIFFCNSKSKRVEKERDGDYTWINFSRLIIDMPLLRLKTTMSISRRIKKIEKAGFIKTRKNKSNRFFVLLENTIDKLFFEGPITLELQGYNSRVTGGITPELQYNTTIDNPTKNTFLQLTSGERAKFLKSLDEIDQSPNGEKNISSAPQEKIPETFTEKINDLQIMKEEDVPYQDVTEVISYFLPILPNQFITRSPFLQKPTQGIIRRALTINTKEDLKSIIEKYHDKQSDTYRPTITTIYTFFSKIDQIKTYLNKATSGLHAHRSISSDDTKAINKKNLDEKIKAERIESAKLRKLTTLEELAEYERKEKEEKEKSKIN